MSIVNLNNSFKKRFFCKIKIAMKNDFMGEKIKNVTSKYFNMGYI